MRFLDYLSMAGRRLKTRLFESIVIIIAIGLGTGVIAAALALRFAFTDYSQRMSSDEHSRSIHISSGESYSFQDAVVRIGEEMVEAAPITLGVLYGVRDNCPDVAYTTLRRGTSLQIGELREELMGPPPSTPEEHLEWMEKREEIYLNVRLTTEDEFLIRDMPLEMGHSFTREDVMEKNRVIVLGFDAAERLFPHTHPLGEEIDVEHQEPFTVIGVLKRQETEEIEDGYRSQEFNQGGIIPITTDPWGIRDLSHPLEMEIHNFIATVNEVERLAEAEGQIRAYLRENLGQGFSIHSPLSWQRELGPTVTRGNIIATFTASLGLLIAAINILNLMMARVLKRTKEIGVISALGTTKKSIFYLFLWEALLLGFFGALLGFGLAIVGERVMASIIEGFIFQVDSRVFFASMGIAGFISLLFGIYPALQAAGIHPVDALRTD